MHAKPGLGPKTQIGTRRPHRPFHILPSHTLPAPLAPLTLSLSTLISLAFHFTAVTTCPPLLKDSSQPPFGIHVEPIDTLHFHLFLRCALSLCSVSLISPRNSS